MRVELRAQSLVETLREALQEAILRGSIRAGDQLTEQGVAATYGIARPTAKAAIEQLVHSGLLRRSHNRAARVPVLDASDVRDLYFNRSLIECGVVSALAADGMDLREAERAIEDQRHAPDIVAFVEADILFHRALVEGLDSPRAKRLHESVIGEAHLCMAQVQLRRLLDPGAIIQEHAAILSAIGDSNAQLAAELMSRHLARARDELVASLSK